MVSIRLFVVAFAALVVVATAIETTQFVSIDVEWPQQEYRSLPPYILHHVHPTVKVREIKLAVGHTLKATLSDKFFLSLSRFSYQPVNDDLTLLQIAPINPQSAIRLFAFIPANDTERDQWLAMEHTDSTEEIMQTLNKQLDDLLEIVVQQIELISSTDEYLTAGQRDLAHFHSHGSHVREFMSKHEAHKHDSGSQRGSQIDTLNSVLQAMSSECSLHEERAQRVSSEASTLLLEFQRLASKQQQRVRHLKEQVDQVPDTSLHTHDELVSALVLRVDELQTDDTQLTESISEIQALEVQLSGHLDDLEHSFHDWQLIRQQMDSLHGVSIKRKGRRHNKAAKPVPHVDNSLIVSSFCSSYVPLVTPCSATAGDCDNAGAVTSILGVVTRHAIVHLFVSPTIRKFMIDLTSNSKQAVASFTEHVIELGHCGSPKAKGHRHDHSSHSNHDERHQIAHSSEDKSAIFFNMLHKISTISLDASDIEEWNSVWLSAFEEMHISERIVRHSFDQLLLSHILDDSHLDDEVDDSIHEPAHPLPETHHVTKTINKPQTDRSHAATSTDKIERAEIDATDSIMQHDVNVESSTVSNGSCLANERSKLSAWLNQGWESCTSMTPALSILKGD